MKTFMTLLLAGGALLSVQGLTAKPAEAFGGCGWWGGGCCRTAVFFRPAAGISLLDALFLATAGAVAASMVALACFASTLALQRWVSGT